MKVREQRIDAPEREARCDEECGASGELLRSNHGLHDSNRRRANSENPLRFSDSRPHVGSNRVPLSVQLVLVEAFAHHRPERVEADVECDPHGIESPKQFGREVKAGGRGRGRPGLAREHGLVPLGIRQRLMDVRRERHLAVRLSQDPKKPATVFERLEQLYRSKAFSLPQPTGGSYESLPDTVGLDLLEQQELHGPSGSTPETKPSGHDPRVIDDDELVRKQVGKVGEDTVLDRPGTSPIHEQPRCVPTLERTLCDELVRQLVVELGGVHPAVRVASAPMDSGALERAKQRIADAAAGRPQPAALEAALERSRGQIETLAATAAELEATIPVQVGIAVRDGLRAEVLPVGRHIAEIRGLLNQTIRRLERIEGELLTERHARVDDLALLVDLVSSGWRGVDARLERLERMQGRAGSSAVVEDIAKHDADDQSIPRAAAA